MAFDRVKERLFGKLDGKQQKLEAASDQSQEDKDLVSYVKSQVFEVRQTPNRIIDEGQWLTNAAYLLGYTNLFYDTTLRVFRPINQPSRGAKGNRIEFNYILPNIQNRLARLTKNPPRYDVRPNSTDDEMKEAARLSLHCINQVWDQQRINKKRLSLGMWMQECGHAFLKQSWDPTLGPKVPVQDDEDGKVKLLSLGDIRVEVCSAFEVFVDPLAKTMEDLTWLIHAKVRPISYFRTQYPGRGDLVKPEGVWLQSLDYQERINSFNAQTGTGSGGANFLKDSAIELMYYEKPNYKNPFGRHVIVASDMLLKDGELPIDEIPFAKFDDVVIGGKFSSESVITHLRPIQDQFNRNLTQRSRWVNRLLAGKYIAARGHGLMKEALTDQSGEVVEFDPVPGAPPPTAMNIPSIPQYTYTEDEFLKSYMNEISGVQEISKGNMPSAGMPAIGMQVLQEADDTRIGTITENNEFGYADVGRHILKFAAKYYTTPRLLKIAGKGMEYAVKSFVGADLKESNDVIVVRGSTLPSSKVLKRQEIINLHQQGYLGSPQDPKVLENVLGMLEYGDIAEAWKDHSLDMAQIQKMIEMIEQEAKPPVSEFDNHALIMQELNRYRKSDKFPPLSDVSKMFLLQTLEEHLTYLVDMAAPESSDIDNDPMLQEKTAAQETEAELQQEVAGELEQEIPIEGME